MRIPTPDEWLIYLKWREAFSRMLDPDYYTIEWLDRLVLDGSAKLLFCEDAAAIVECRTYPTGTKEAHALLASGNLSSIVDALIPAFIEYGGSIGAKSAVIESREGWIRAIKHIGFDPYQVSLRKEL